VESTDTPAQLMANSTIPSPASPLRAPLGGWRLAAGGRRQEAGGRRLVAKPSHAAYDVCRPTQGRHDSCRSKVRLLRSLAVVRALARLSARNSHRWAYALYCPTSARTALPASPRIIGAGGKAASFVANSTSPEDNENTVAFALETFGIGMSERRAWRVLGCCRMTMRYQAPLADRGQ
jgi:hypothetical protein